MGKKIIGRKDPTILNCLSERLRGFDRCRLGQVLHNRYFDPAASILIGLLLAAVALLLGRESGALLVGERTNRARIRR